MKEKALDLTSCIQMCGSSSVSLATAATSLSSEKLFERCPFCLSVLFPIFSVLHLQCHLLTVEHNTVLTPPTLFSSLEIFNIYIYVHQDAILQRHAILIVMPWIIFNTWDVLRFVVCLLLSNQFPHRDNKIKLHCIVSALTSPCLGYAIVPPKTYPLFWANIFTLKVTAVYSR